MLRRFFTVESAGGICMLVAALAALLSSNSPLHGAYVLWISQPIGGVPLQDVVQNVLIVPFFALVGLELKNERAFGVLRDARHALPPLLAVIGGSLLPALLFMQINAGVPGNAAGWAIPVATDIAFALCVLNVSGAVPQSVKIFLLTMAIFDDLAAVVIIALFYGQGFDPGALYGVAASTLLLFAVARCGCRRLWVYAALCALNALALHGAGIHTSVAGVLTGLAVPAALVRRGMVLLHPWVSFGVLPLFAFTAAGADLRGFGLERLYDPLTLGIILGLWLGKPVGIIAAVLPAVRLRFIRLPEDFTVRRLCGVAALSGIGFTMSLFIGALAFGPARGDAVRIGVMCGSVLSALGGLWILRTARVGER